MQIGEQGLPAAQLPAFGDLRLLDLHDEIAAGENVLRTLCNQRARRLIVRILEADTRTGAALHEHLMSRIDELTNARRHQSNTILVNLDLFGDADFHESLRSLRQRLSTARVRKPVAGKLQKLVPRQGEMAEYGGQWPFAARNCRNREGHQMKLD